MAGTGEEAEREGGTLTTGPEAEGHPEEEGGVAERKERTEGGDQGRREAVGPQQRVSHDMYPKRRAGDGSGRRGAAWRQKNKSQETPEGEGCGGMEVSRELLGVLR